ncbi:hypothetical protein M404DRAFT_999216 [Pisolithus tinctorius Marx 270]|uniref:Uncharacterized protein n=1 Tax=Pisolithus tinctorius Marx 270 TaxID=870435 RepID=A0A0C3PD43_PISTI|nr:hypothetical protein M404DRAFT_999216 [Pisolithus tinctorius Marx 270]
MSRSVSDDSFPPPPKRGKLVNPETSGVFPAVVPESGALTDVWTVASVLSFPCKAGRACRVRSFT